MVFVRVLSVSLSLWFLSKAAEHSGIPDKSCFWLFHSNCLCWQLFCFLDSVFAWFQKDIQSMTLTHFSRQTLSLKVYYWAIPHEGQGLKSSHCIQTTTSEMWKYKCFSVTYYSFPSRSFTFKVHCCCFYSPCPALPFPAILFIIRDPNFKPLHFIHSLQQHQSTLLTPIFQLSVNLMELPNPWSLQRHSEEIQLSRNHCTNESKS